ncbi:hypothetical protein KI659_18345, partial [Litoribacter alkaliphilus]
DCSIEVNTPSIAESFLSVQCTERSAWTVNQTELQQESGYQVPRTRYSRTEVFLAVLAFAVCRRFYLRGPPDELRSADGLSGTER